MKRRRAGVEPLIRHVLAAEQQPEALDLLEKMAFATSPPTISVGGQEVDIPPALLQAWLDIGTMLVCRGRATVLVLDENQECSRNEAANILDVAVSKVSVLLASGALASRKVGTDTRIELSSVVSLKTGEGRSAADAPRLVIEKTSRAKQKEHPVEESED